jgi:glycosyltransferase involved in cell wall biosynthesis
MRIGYVAEPYEEKNASGMGYVISELLKHLLVLGRGHEVTVFSTKHVSRDFIPGQYKTVAIPKGFFKKIVWFRKHRDIDVLLYMAPLLALFPPRSTRTIVLCQELSKFSGSALVGAFSFIRDTIVLPRAFAHAHSIVVPSEATKQDILERYRVAPEKIVVIPDGFQDLSVYANEYVEPKISQPYFFFAGKVKERKNVHGIVRAFVLFKKKTAESVQLVIAGDYGGPYYEEIMKTLRDGGVAEDVHFVGYTTQAQLYSYYRGAIACVFPSFSEGFGMPIIEAMSLGVPVITSNISSMAEVAGEAGLLVNPYEPQSIADAMENVYANTKLRHRLIEKGISRAAEFSWQRAAREVFAVLQEKHLT